MNKKKISITVPQVTYDQWKRLLQYRSVTGGVMIEKIIEAEINNVYDRCYITYGLVSPDDYNPDE